MKSNVDAENALQIQIKYNPNRSKNKYKNPSPIIYIRPVKGI